MNGLKIPDSVGEFRKIYEWIAILLKLESALVSRHFFRIYRIFSVPSVSVLLFFLGDRHFVASGKVKESPGDVTLVHRRWLKHRLATFARQAEASFGTF